MEGSYEVFLEKRAVGKVQVRREGLYYAICCRCDLNGDAVYRLWAKWKDRQENLGVVIPEENGGFFLKRKIPAKYLGDGPIQFFLAPKREHMSGEFIPIHPEEPFAYIDRLNTAFLETQNGQLGIRL